MYQPRTYKVDIFICLFYYVLVEESGKALEFYLKYRFYTRIIIIISKENSSSIHLGCKKDTM